MLQSLGVKGEPKVGPGGENFIFEYVLGSVLAATENVLGIIDGHKRTVFAN